MAQEKQDFPVILSSDYLAVPNNLLLSLSLSLSLSLIGAPSLIPHKNILLYAREPSCATPIGKGFHGDSLARITVSFSKALSFDIRPV